MNRLYRQKKQKKKKKKPLKRLIGTLIILVLFGLLFKGCQYSIHFVTTLNAFKIAEIKVNVPANIPKERIIKLSGLNNQIGLYDISLSELKNRIKKDPWVRSIRIWRTPFPPKITFTIMSKEVVALAKVNGSIYYVDETGVVIDKLIIGYKNDLPIINISSGNYKQVTDIMEKLKTLGEISEISLEENILTLYTSGSNMKISLDSSKLENGIALIKKVVADLNEKGETASALDATLPGNKVVVKGLRKN
jgi:cell division septal protein FtsQ